MHCSTCLVKFHECLSSCCLYTVVTKIIRTPRVFPLNPTVNKSRKIECCGNKTYQIIQNMILSWVFCEGQLSQVSIPWFWYRSKIVWNKYSTLLIIFQWDLGLNTFTQHSMLRDLFTVGFNGKTQKLLHLAIFY